MRFELGGGGVVIRGISGVSIAGDGVGDDGDDGGGAGGVDGKRG